MKLLKHWTTILRCRNSWTCLNMQNRLKHATHMSKGARLACYAPTTIQLEAAWDACEEIGLTIEWAGEVIERPWSRASKGGLKPSKGDFGHTAFLLFAKK